MDDERKNHSGFVRAEFISHCRIAPPKTMPGTANIGSGWVDAAPLIDDAMIAQYFGPFFEGCRIDRHVFATHHAFAALPVWYQGKIFTQN